jgi:hypothetical protein
MFGFCSEFCVCLDRFVSLLSLCVSSRLEKSTEYRTQSPVRNFLSLFLLRTIIIDIACLVQESLEVLNHYRLPSSNMLVNLNPRTLPRSVFLPAHTIPRGSVLNLVSSQASDRQRTSTLDPRRLRESSFDRVLPTTGAFTCFLRNLPLRVFSFLQAMSCSRDLHQSLKTQFCMVEDRN